MPNKRRAQPRFIHFEYSDNEGDMDHVEPPGNKGDGDSLTVNTSQKDDEDLKEPAKKVYTKNTPNEADRVTHNKQRGSAQPGNKDRNEDNTNVESTNRRGPPSPDIEDQSPAVPLQRIKDRVSQKPVDLDPNNDNVPNRTADGQNASTSPWILQIIKDNVWVLVCVLVVFQAVAFYQMLRLSSINSEQQTAIDELKKQLEVSNNTDRSGNLAKIQDDIKQLHDTLKKYPDKESVKSEISDVTNNFVDKGKFFYDIGSVNKKYEEIEYIKEKKNEIINILATNPKLTEDLDNLTKTIEALDNAISERITDLMGNVAELERAAEDNTKTLSTQQHMQTNLERQVNEQKDKLNTSTHQIEATVAAAKQELQQNLLEADEALKRVKSETTKIQDIQKEQENLLGLIKPNTFNKGAVTTAALIIIVIVFVLVIAVYIVCQRLPPEGAARNRPSGGSSHQPEQNSHTHSIVKRIPSNPALENGICVISYDDETQTLHRNLLLSCMTEMPERAKNAIKFHIVNRHEAILDISRKKMCFIFTEFSERHVIIEEQGLGLGDLKLTTAQSMLKMGCKSVMVYVHDPGSRKLGNGQLYNHDIDCVTRQEILSSHNEQRCFFSVYDKFTDFQKTSISSLISEYGSR